MILDILNSIQLFLSFLSEILLGAALGLLLAFLFFRKRVSFSITANVCRWFLIGIGSIQSIGMILV